MSRFLCGLGLHRWSVWSVAKRGNLLNGTLVVGSYFQQTRHCQDCGKMEMREIASL